MQAMSRSPTTTKRDGSGAKGSTDQLPNPHPGEILKREFLNETGLSQNQLAQAIGDSDLRLCRFFGLSEGYFLRLQNAYDTLQPKRRIADQLAAIKPYEPQHAA